jgi:hypothetical protein
MVSHNDRNVHYLCHYGYKEFVEVIRIGVLDAGAIPASSTKSTPCWPLADDRIETVSGTI